MQNALLTTLYADGGNPPIFPGKNYYSFYSVVLPTRRLQMCCEQEECARAVFNEGESICYLKGSEAVASYHDVPATGVSTYTIDTREGKLCRVNRNCMKALRYKHSATLNFCDFAQAFRLPKHLVEVHCTDSLFSKIMRALGSMRPMPDIVDMSVRSRSGQHSRFVWYTSVVVVIHGPRKQGSLLFSAVSVLLGLCG